MSWETTIWSIKHAVKLSVSVSPPCTIQHFIKQQRQHLHCVGFIFVIRTDLVGQSAVLCNAASSVKPAKTKCCFVAFQAMTLLQFGEAWKTSPTTRHHTPKQWRITNWLCFTAHLMSPLSHPSPQLDSQGTHASVLFVDFSLAFNTIILHTTSFTPNSPRLGIITYSTLSICTAHTNDCTRTPLC